MKRTPKPKTRRATLKTMREKERGRIEEECRKMKKKNNVGEEKRLLDFLRRNWSEREEKRD